MKLGILVNTDKNLKHITGIAQAAVNKGHDVLIFAMDDGVSLMRNTAFTDLCKIKGASISFAITAQRRLRSQRRPSLRKSSAAASIIMLQWRILPTRS